MKGVVFTEFLSMLDTKFDPIFIENLLEEARLPSGGVYTSVGTYDYKEMITLVTLLSEKTGLGIPVLKKAFGEYLLGVFIRQHPSMFDSDDNTFTVLTRLNNSIHVDVRKLYPDAELPTFNHQWLDQNRLELIYQSPRPFADVAEELITACIGHFNDTIRCTREELGAIEGTHAKFLLVRDAA